MRVEKDFEDFIRSLRKNNAKYLIIGAFAVSFYTRPRATGDIDFFIRNSSDNIQNTLKALKDFGFGSLNLSEGDFQEDMIIQLGIEPNRIYLIPSIPGIEFDTAYANRVPGQYGDETANFISFEDLISTKKASGRPKDMGDIELLEKFKTGRK